MDEVSIGGGESFQSPAFVIAATDEDGPAVTSAFQRMQGLIGFGKSIQCRNNSCREENKNVEEDGNRVANQTEGIPVTSWLAREDGNPSTSQRHRRSVSHSLPNSL